MRDGAHADHRHRRLRAPQITREFRHRVAATGQHILRHAFVRQDLAFDHNFGVRDGFRRHRHARREFHGALPYRSSHAQFVEPEWRSGRLETRGQVDGRVQPDVDRNGQRAPGSFGLLAEHVDVAAGNEIDAQTIRRNGAHSMDRHVGGTGLRIFGAYQPHGEEWPGVVRGVCRDGQQAQDIERGAMHDLLARRGGIADDRRNRRLQRVGQHRRNALHRRA